VRRFPEYGVQSVMKFAVVTDNVNAWLLATLIMFLGDTAMARSLKLADPSELAGQWQVIVETGQSVGTAVTCWVDLNQDQTLSGQLDCLAPLLGQAPVGWFPEPDGIALTDDNGSRSAFFSQQRNGFYTLTFPAGLKVSLQRASK